MDEGVLPQRSGVEDPHPRKAQILCQNGEIGEVGSRW
jgi:hypothetical protein